MNYRDNNDRLRMPLGFWIAIVLASHDIPLHHLNKPHTPNSSAEFKST